MELIRQTKFGQLNNNLFFSTCPLKIDILLSVMKTTNTYTIQELLSKHPHNQDLQKIDWTKKKDDIEFALSSILGGDWTVNKKNKTVKL